MASCDPRQALVYDSGTGKDRYTVFLCKDVLMADNQKLIGKLGTTKDIQPCSCLGKQIAFAKLPAPVQAALQRRALRKARKGR
jgi:hypothetical protein